MKRAVVNFGHGPKNVGYDPGAIGPTGYQEATQTKEVGQKVVDKLKANGWTVLAIQDGDLEDIVNQSNAWKPDYFISIHANSFADPNAHGIETYAYTAGGMGEKIAADVHKELISATGLTDRKVKFASYYVLKYTNCPAILAELGFISNPTEEALMKQDSWDDKVASAICRGFSRAVGEPYVEPGTAAPALTPQLTEDPDIHLSVRVRTSKADAVVDQIIGMGYACKKLDLA